MKMLSLILLVLLIPSIARTMEDAPPLPQGPAKWLNGESVQWTDLKGKVVLLNVWTFACWNSYRSLPWVVSLQQKFPDLQILGIHSPEFDYEKDRNKLRSTMRNYGVDYPQLLDDNHGYWDQLDNRYWPAFYVVDKQGRIRGRFAGETHADDRQAREIEKLIAALSQES